MFQWQHGSMPHPVPFAALLVTLQHAHAPLEDRILLLAHHPDEALHRGHIDLRHQCPKLTPRLLLPPKGILPGVEAVLQPPLLPQLLQHG